MTQLAQARDDGQFFVLPEQKLMFVSVAKNACTTLKWMMADIAGEDLSAARAGLTSFTEEAHIVHNRSKWKRSPKPSKLAPEILDQIHPDNGWFVFAVLRDPRVRFFSAWQDKLLLRNPAYNRFADEPWFPHYPAGADEIVADFARFADLLAANPRHRLLQRDVHFRAQTSLLARELVTYSRIYEMSEIRQLRADVSAHLKSVGLSGEVTLRDANSTPLRMNGALFADGVREKVEQIYAVDFEEFGDRWDFAKIAAAGPWSHEAIAEARSRAATNNRIGELRDIALGFRQEIVHLKARIGELEAASAPAGAPADAPAGIAGGPAGIAAGVGRRLRAWRAR